MPELPLANKVLFVCSFSIMPHKAEDSNEDAETSVDNRLFTTIQCITGSLRQGRFTVLSAAESFLWLKTAH